MTLFDKNAFLRANQKRQEEFAEIDDGLYICTLNDAEVGPSKSSNRLQLKLEWIISDNDPVAPGKRIYQTVQLEKEDEEKRETAYSIVAMLASQLGIRNMEAFAEDPNTLLNKCIDTKARIQKSTNDGGYSNIRIRKILERTYSETDYEGFNQGLQSTQDDSVQETTSQEVIVDVGQKVIATTPVGQLKGKIKEVRDADNIIVQTINGDAISCKLLNLTFADFDDEIPDEPEQQTSATELLQGIPADDDEVEEIPMGVTFSQLEKGMTVKGVFNDEVIVGAIHALKEEQGLVVIAKGNKGYPCKLDTITLV